MTLCDAEEQLLARYGYYAEHTENLVMPGSDGTEKMRALMERLRRQPPETFAGKTVLGIRDYESGQIRRIDGSTGETGLPKSDVLYFELDGGSNIIIRPSGTEPKVKIYLMARGDTADETAALLAAFKEAIQPWKA